MTEKTKNTNYTDAMVTRLREHYDPLADEETRTRQVRELAEEFGKTPASVRSKLVREKLYVAKEYKTKTGAKPATKETIVGDIARVLGVDADSQLSGLEKATKNCLLFLFKTVQVAAEISGESEETDS